MQRSTDTIQRLIHNVEQVIVGKRDLVEMLVVALVCRGHVLIEDVPGVGKTMAARALARSVALDCKRLQCTPDLLPSDITGVPIFNQKTVEFEFRPGPVFTNILIADELNRATPRAQSALLESMEEFQVSIDGQVHPLPAVFMVVATQNPIEMAGTYVLPEAQADRFLVRLQVGYPTLDEEVHIIGAQTSEHPIHALKPVVDEQELLQARESLKNVHMGIDVTRYIAAITAATRSHPAVRLGVSPRGSLALARAAKALALAHGDNFVTPAHVKATAPAVLLHRLSLRPQALTQGLTAAKVLDAVVYDIVAPPV